MDAVNVMAVVAFPVLLLYSNIKIRSHFTAAAFVILPARGACSWLPWDTVPCAFWPSGGRQLCCRDERAGHQTTVSHARAHIWSRLVTLTQATPSSVHCKGERTGESSMWSRLCSTPCGVRIYMHPPPPTHPCWSKLGVMQNIYLAHIHYRSKVWDHLEMTIFQRKAVFSIKITLN